MRRRRKVRYDVTDWFGDAPHLWWQRGRWVADTKGKGGCTHAHAWTLRQALRIARAAIAQGGKPLITRWFYKKGVRCCQDFKVNY